MGMETGKTRWGGREGTGGYTMAMHQPSPGLAAPMGGCRVMGITASAPWRGVSAGQPGRMWVPSPPSKGCSPLGWFETLPQAFWDS